jgi:DNA invertase Pin-like site-specific DNA recombinase
LLTYFAFIVVITIQIPYTSCVYTI